LDVVVWGDSSRDLHRVGYGAFAGIGCRKKLTESFRDRFLRNWKSLVRMVFFFGYWSVGVAVRPDQLLTQNYLGGVSPTRADVLDFDSIILNGNGDLYRGFLRRNPMIGSRINTMNL
jgi:hypothetical protein